MTYTYRAAHTGEHDIIFDLYRLVMRDLITAIWGWNESWQADDFAAYFNAKSITLVHHETTLVAYSQIENSPDRLFIRMILVHPQHQGQGIGTQLLRTAIELGETQTQRIGLEVFKINREAKLFYQRHGFKVEGETASSFVMAR